MTLTLRELRLEDQAAFEAAVNEWRLVGEPMYDFAFSFDRETETFADYVAKLQAWTRGERLPDEFVPCSYLIGVDSDGRIAGRVSIRHRLNDILARLGGHIGYMVLPSHRRRGVGTAMLAAAIPVARQLGIDRILVTCDEDNIGSRRIIEANGGIYEGSIEEADRDQPKRRYWIEAK